LIIGGVSSGCEDLGRHQCERDHIVLMQNKRTVFCWLHELCCFLLVVTSQLYEAGGSMSGLDTESKYNKKSW